MNIRDIVYKDRMVKFVSIIPDHDVNIYNNNLGDEWYLVLLYYNDGSCDYYKCDQFEGLERLISDKLGIDYIREDNQYNEYYYQISDDEYNKYGDKYVTFSVELVGWLRDKFINYNIRMYNDDFIVFDTDLGIDRLNKYGGDVVLFSCSVGLNNIILKCLRDEWYLVTIRERNKNKVCYKCDQFDGLERLIEDKLGGYISESIDFDNINGWIS